jgi:plastocyanin
MEECMHKTLRLVLTALALIAFAAPSLRGDNDNDRGNQTVEMVDDCDPRDTAGWAPVGCLLRKGDVTAAEFGALLTSPLYDNIPGAGGLFLVGHPSWRNEPSHIVIEAGKKLRIKNVGGRPHTFTQVAQFGGGVVPPLNVGTQPAPECATLVVVAPGDRTTLTARDEGLQRFQCCFHPWMRATVRVVPDDRKDRDDDDDDDD